MAKRLLIIEDDPDMAFLIKNRAIRLNFSCELDTSGIEWKEIIKKQPPHAIILDMDLPRMSGFSILRQLKAHEDYQSIPVFVWSGTDDLEVVQEAKSLGAHAYVFKSEDLEILFNKIQEL
jgi:two-component system, OmpR family, alkaline phosphatase synthesis response regulator PhoP